MGKGTVDKLDKSAHLLIERIIYYTTKGLIRLALMDMDKLDKPAHAKS